MKPEPDPHDALKSAVEKAGGQSALARLLSVSQPSVWAWIQKGKHLPGEHVLRVEAFTGVSRHDLRPDLYPREPATATNALSATSLEAAR